MNSSMIPVSRLKHNTNTKCWSVLIVELKVLPYWHVSLVSIGGVIRSRIHDGSYGLNFAVTLENSIDAIWFVGLHGVTEEALELGALNISGVPAVISRYYRMKYRFG